MGDASQTKKCLAFRSLVQVVVSNVTSGILFARFPTVEHVSTIELSLWHHKTLKEKNKRESTALTPFFSHI